MLLLRVNCCLLFFFSFSFSLGQQAHLYPVAFYNVENLFDTIDNPTTFDEEYTPSGRKQWTEKVLEQKIEQLAKVIATIGIEETKTPPILIGLAEVENRKVLEQLLAHPILKKYNYGIIHHESSDFRGIDVALLYRKKHFIPSSSKTYSLRLTNEKTQQKYASRDILLVSGYIKEEEVQLLVNHWPSRRGGAKRSRPKRMQASRLHKRIMDSLFRLDSQVKLISMGDYNDNPNDKSIKNLTEKNKENNLFNPMESLQKKGIASLAYNDKWFLFDQFLLSPSLKMRSGLFFFKAKVFNPSYLQTPSGKYKGYPYRVKVEGGNNLEGYSDHFPVYLILAKKIKKNK